MFLFFHCFCFNASPTTAISTLSLHDALPIYGGRSDLLFQTSDTTWQAYNQYGGNSLYVGAPAGRAYKVSYNRPLTVRGTRSEEHTSELQSLRHLVCRLLLEKKKKSNITQSRA